MDENGKFDWPLLEIKVSADFLLREVEHAAAALSQIEGSHEGYPWKVGALEARLQGLIGLARRQAQAIRAAHAQLQEEAEAREEHGIPHDPRENY